MQSTNCKQKAMKLKPYWCECHRHSDSTTNYIFFQFSPLQLPAAKGKCTLAAAAHVHTQPLTQKILRKAYCLKGGSSA